MGGFVAGTLKDNRRKSSSERKLFYAKPFLQTNEMGREALYYRGINQETKKWESIPTYGGNLIEKMFFEN